MRVTFVLILGMAVAALVGCGKERTAHIERMSDCNCSPPLALRPSPYLIFDRTPPEPAPPGMRPLTAEDFTLRSDWPSTAGYHSAGEVVYFREWYYDHLGYGANPLDYNNRTFQSYRYGAKFRP